ncbi:winged helix-turn-helix transcriptional regulator [Nocardia sp. KC 131]|uniref:winged helix-turn-helix transcriptional regulator n=1 Tax=Nocardia arseniciresistens TaxID=3392119 RepID=UPI00398EB5E5
MRRTSFENMNCSIAQCLEVVGEWWTLLIVRDALMGVTRFDDFRERLGIARNVLTQRLEHLVAHDIMSKVPYQDNPVRYDYRLTPRGRSLWQVLTAMRQWGDDWAAPEGPPVQTLHKTCGHITVIQPTCSECGEHVHRRDLELVDGPGVRDVSLIPGR